MSLCFLGYMLDEFTHSHSHLHNPCILSYIALCSTTLLYCILLLLATNCAPSAGRSRSRRSGSLRRGASPRPSRSSKRRYTHSRQLPLTRPLTPWLLTLYLCSSLFKGYQHLFNPRPVISLFSMAPVETEYYDLVRQIITPQNTRNTTMNS